MPDSDYYGVDSFTYYDVNGPASSNLATVYLTVYSVPRPLTMKDIRP